jgi:hypothetical protein
MATGRGMHPAARRGVVLMTPARSRGRARRRQVRTARIVLIAIIVAVTLAMIIGTLPPL